MTPEPLEIAKGIPVSTGWTWTTTFVAINAAILTTIGVWLKKRPEMFKTKKDAEERLRDDLIARVERLELRLEEERAQHEAAMAMMRHRLNNSDQSIEALLIMLDDDELPERIKTKVARIRELRERQRKAEERERDTIRAAVVAAKTVSANPPIPTP